MKSHLLIRLQGEKGTVKHLDRKETTRDKEIKKHKIGYTCKHKVPHTLKKTRSA
jgi:hypothetical protein